MVPFETGDDYEREGQRAQPRGSGGGGGDISSVAYDTRVRLTRPPSSADSSSGVGCIGSDAAQQRVALLSLRLQTCVAQMSYSPVISFHP